MEVVCGPLLGTALLGAALLGVFLLLRLLLRVLGVAAVGSVESGTALALCREVGLLGFLWVLGRCLLLRVVGLLGLIGVRWVLGGTWLLRGTGLLLLLVGLSRTLGVSGTFGVDGAFRVGGTFGVGGTFRRAWLFWEARLLLLVGLVLIRARGRRTLRILLGLAPRWLALSSAEFSSFPRGNEFTASRADGLLLRRGGGLRFVLLGLLLLLRELLLGLWRNGEGGLWLCLRLRLGVLCLD